MRVEITEKKLPDLCNNGAMMNLMPYVLNSTGTWQGNGVAGNSFDPALAGKGTHMLTYTTASIPSER